MRILFTIAHYYKFSSESALYSSLSSLPEIRLGFLSNCLASLYQNFSLFQGTISWAYRSAFLANQSQNNTLDIIICTTGDYHLLKQLTIPSEFYQHYSTQAEPLLLGFECQQVLSENIDKYDYFCFLEDDLIIRDPLFFIKLDWFNHGAGDSCLLQPNRYEVNQKKKPFKAYIDGDLLLQATENFQNVDEAWELEGDLLGIATTFRRALNPHSGCYFLNQQQMKYWSEQSYFMDRDTTFVGPLESAATLGIMKTFRVYKTVPEQAYLFEIEHSGSRYLDAIGNTINQSYGW
jgi:hypothetical protein